MLMRTKLYTLLFVILTSISAAFAQALYDGCYYIYDEETKGMAFAGCYKSDVVNLTIPSHVEFNDIKYPVTKIKYQACKGYTNLKSVSIPSTVVAIGGYAFQY